MALVCDYCGDVTEATERVSVAFGHNQEIALKGSTAREWFYYCEGECADRVKDMLTNLRLYALHGEGSGLVWALTEQAVAPVAEGVKPAGTPPPEAEAKPEGFDWDKATPFEERQQQRKETEKMVDSPEVRQRAGALPLSWYLKRETSIPITELSARIATGIGVHTVVKHQGSKGNLYNAGIATLEDAAAMTEVEFAGLPGVGAKVLAHVVAGLKKHSLQFRPGPTLEQLGTVLRGRREDEGLSIEDLTPLILAAIEAPEVRSDDDDCRSKAWWHVEAALKDSERGNKGLAPQLLDVLGEAFGSSRAGLLAEAMQVEPV